MAWGIRPGIWFLLPRWERAAMEATVVAKNLVDAAAMKTAVDRSKDKVKPNA